LWRALDRGELRLDLVPRRLASAQPSTGYAGAYHVTPYACPAGQALFIIRSERQLMEQISYNVLFRWLVGLAMDVPVWDVTVFTKNRDRLLQGGPRVIPAALKPDSSVRRIPKSA
jgi:hypothetical protein